MSEDAQNKDVTQDAPKSRVDELIQDRLPLVTIFNAAKEAIAAQDAKIAAAQREEFEAKQAAALQTILPGADKNALKGSDVQFLLSFSKESKDVTAAGVTAAYRVFSLFKDSGVEDAKVAARFFGKEGANYLESVKLETNGNFISQGKGYNSPTTTGRDFLPAVNEILTAGTPSNYIIVSDGIFANDVADIARRLKAAADLNPKATFDFVVANAADTKVDELVNKLKEAGIGNQVNLVKVGTTAEITNVAKNIIKARLGGTVYTQAAPARPEPALVAAVKQDDTAEVSKLLEPAAAKTAARPAR